MMQPRDIALSLSPLKSSFGSLLFSGDLERGLRTARSLSYNGVELSLLDGTRIDGEWLLRILAELGLPVFAIATGQTYHMDGYSLFAA